MALTAIGSKGLFTEELERDLREGVTDLCVHSLKDLPTDDPIGLTVIAQLPREDSRDALVVRDDVPGALLHELPHGAIIGTSSLRRRAQLKALRPDCTVVDLRGNVGTRLAKLDKGLCHAAILAAAGLQPPRPRRSRMSQLPRRARSGSVRRRAGAQSPVAVPAPTMRR
ncbi:MAG: hypothetical protein U5K74_07935 [Gemmatimonadaceae bacterium]|nr:hypothetical protein [Gemmatimonadaceae bacterium]